VPVEEAAVPATHVMVADHPALTYTDCSQILQTVHKSRLVNPLRQRPMLLGNHLIIAFRSRQIPRPRLKLLRKRLVVEENPRILRAPNPNQASSTNKLSIS
jgi:hypothetical protein